MQGNAEKYLNKDRLPHIWCPGCGNGIVLGALIRAFDRLGVDQDKTVVISGIGCSSRAAGYPVSYTHLDVYKRQGSTPSPFFHCAILVVLDGQA